jgi:hypothetical protein
MDQRQARVKNAYQDWIGDLCLLAVSVWHVLIAVVMRYMHSQGIIHHNLRPDTILVVWDWMISTVTHTCIRHSRAIDSFHVSRTMHALHLRSYSNVTEKERWSIERDPRIHLSWRSSDAIRLYHWNLFDVSMSIWKSKIVAVQRMKRSCGKRRDSHLFLSIFPGNHQNGIDGNGSRAESLGSRHTWRLWETCPRQSASVSRWRDQTMLFYELSHELRPILSP